MAFSLHNKWLNYTDGNVVDFQVGVGQREGLFGNPQQTCTARHFHVDDRQRLGVAGGDNVSDFLSIGAGVIQLGTGNSNGLSLIHI